MWLVVQLTRYTGLDLHDLHDLRSRILLFIHDLLESLRAAGVCHHTTCRVYRWLTGLPDPRFLSTSSF